MAELDPLQLMSALTVVLLRQAACRRTSSRRCRRRWQRSSGFGWPTWEGEAWRFGWWTMLSTQQVFCDIRSLEIMCQA